MPPRVVRTARTLGTHLALARLHLIGQAKGICVTTRVHPSARIDPGARFEVLVGPGTCVQLELDEDAHIESGCLIRLTAGASVLIGPRSRIRRFAVLNVAGRLALLGDNLVSWHSVIHCAEEVVLESMAGTGEGVTIVDSSHYRAHDQDHWYGNSTTAPVHIRHNVWLASRSTIARGVTIHPAATVAAGSVVLDDVPAGALVAGSPARVTGGNRTPTSHDLGGNDER